MIKLLDASWWKQTKVILFSFFSSLLFYLGSVDCAQGSWSLRTVCQWKTHRGFGMKSAEAPRATSPPPASSTSFITTIYEGRGGANIGRGKIYSDFCHPCESKSIESTLWIYRRVFRGLMNRLYDAMCYVNKIILILWKGDTPTGLQSIHQTSFSSSSIQKCLDQQVGTSMHPEIKLFRSKKHFSQFLFLPFGTTEEGQSLRSTARVRLSFFKKTLESELRRNKAQHAERNTASSSQEIYVRAQAGHQPLWSLFPAMIRYRP